MKKITYRMKLFSAMIILAIMILPANVVFAAGTHKPITHELINLVEKNPEIQNILEKSIAEAKKNQS